MTVGPNMTVEQQLHAITLLNMCQASLQFFASHYCSKVAEQKADKVARFLEEVKQNGTVDRLSETA